jgi:hypothetical protein
VGWGSSVGIATRYGLEGPVSNPGVGENFHTRPDQSWGQPPVQWVPGFSLGVKRPGRGVVHPPHLAPRLKKEYNYIFIAHLGLRGLF